MSINSWQILLDHFFYSNKFLSAIPLCLETIRGSLNFFNPYSTALTTLIAFVENESGYSNYLSQLNEYRETWSA